MTRDPSAEVRTVVGAREHGTSQTHCGSGRSPGPGGKGRPGLWVHRPSQHDLEASQRSGGSCRNTAGGLRSESIYRARGSGARGGL